MVKDMVKDKVKVKEKDMDKYKEKEKAIENVYQQSYPRKEGRAKGVQKAIIQIKNDADLKWFTQAVQNYKAHVEQTGTEKQYIKHFSTFVGSKDSPEWRDWIDHYCDKQGCLRQKRNETQEETIGRLYREYSGQT